MTNNKQIYGQMNKKLIVGFAIILCIFQVSATNLWTENLNDGLVAYYNLDETSGIILESVNGINNGAMNGGTQGLSPPWAISGKAINFSSQTSYFTTNGVFNLAPPFTINAWIYIKDYGVDNFISCSEECSGNGGLSFEVSGSNKLNLAKMCVNGGVFSNNVVNKDSWQMITAVYDGANVFFYINGTADGTPAYSSAQGTNVNYITGNTRGKNVGGHMYMDELSIWNRSLTAEEISYLYDNGNGMTYLRCAQNSDCGNVSVQRMCIGNNVVDRTTTPTCNSGICSMPTTDFIVQTCSYQCANGSCIYYSYWAMENYTFGGEKYPMLAAYSNGILGNVGAIKQGLNIISIPGVYSALNFYDVDTAILAVLFWDGINFGLTQPLIVSGDITGENIIGNDFIGKSYDAQTYYSAEGIQGISASGTDCTITEIKGGIVTGANCI